jgi:serine/threonine protein kinase
LLEAINERRHPLTAEGMSAEHFKTADDSFVGCTLGSYRITSVLSVGGMGSVYRAQHELLDRPAAIKLLRPELTENDELVQRFFNEAKAATAIRHPGIVEVYDFGYTDDGLAYLVMELIDGEPLSKVIAARGRCPELEAAQIARSIASALKAAHAKGIVHRDLKPDNVFLVPDPDGREVRVKVLDFGIAKLANPPTSDRRRTQTGVLMGTPKYMAPEQAREAGTIDHRADLYSLGCILYELLVGEPPFLADGAGEIIAMQLFTEPDPPSRRAPVSAEMDQLVLRLLAKEPSDRPQTAAALMEQLGTIYADAVGFSSAREIVDSKSHARVSGSAHVLHDTIPSTPSVEMLAPKRSRWPLLLAGAAVMIAAGVVAFFLSRTPEPPAAVVAPPAPAPAPAPEVVESAPEVVPPAPQPTPPERPVVVVKKKPAPKSSAKIETPAPAPKTPEKPVQLKTDQGSPLETDIGDGPRQPKVP